jgi:hypothetical protein
MAMLAFLATEEKKWTKPNAGATWRSCERRPRA